tara:strand:+ start:137 stop:478 length:342 start_codon:yes stop_codon:yes gene_type:complete
MVNRLDRVSSLLKQEIALIISQKINDKRIGFISITGIKISKDLSDAWVYYSQIGSDQEKEITKRGLYSAQKFIKMELGKIIALKKIPNLHFRYDKAIESGSNIIHKINNITSE